MRIYNPFKKLWLDKKVDNTGFSKIMGSEKMDYRTEELQKQG